jgi:transcriptional regulator with XRE-family HTH domain
LIAQQPNFWFNALQAASIMDLKETVAANIRRLRLKRGLSQSELARRAKVDRSYLNRLEHAAYDTRLDLIAKIAMALKGEPAELLKTDRPQTPKRDK